MATGGSPGRKDEDFRYTCTLCMEPYRGRSPKILPCFHSFCLPCLTALEASVTSAVFEGCQPEDEEKEMAADDEQAHGEDREIKDEKESPHREQKASAISRHWLGDANVVVSQNDSGKTFLCPTCRAPVTVPEGGVAFLQNNFYVDHERNADEDQRLVLCDMCEEGKQQSATHSCQDCTLNICRSCRRQHDMIARDHHVTAVSLGQPAQDRKEKNRCLVHRDQALCFHCHQCQINICLHCKFSSHEGHDTVELAKAVLDARKEVTSLVAAAQQQIQVMQSSLRSTDHRERQLTRHVQEVTRKVHAQFDQLMSWGQQARDRLLDAVSCKEETEKRQLEAEKSSMTANVDKLSSLVSLLAQSAENDPDVMLLRNELKAALLSEDMLDHHQQRADSQDSVWSWTYDDSDGLSVLQALDVQAYMGNLVDGNIAAASKLVSLQELMDKVGRLFTFMSETTTRMSTLTEKESDLEKKIMSMSDEMTSLEKKSATLTDKLKKEVNAVQQRTASLEHDMIGLKKKATAHADDITYLMKNEADQKKDVTSLQRDVLSLQKSEADTKKIMKSLTEIKKWLSRCFKLRNRQEIWNGI